jgi:hypothetical protein
MSDKDYGDDSESDECLAFVLAIKHSDKIPSDSEWKIVQAIKGLSKRIDKIEEQISRGDNHAM